MKIRIVSAIGPGDPIEVEIAETETTGILRKRACDARKIPENVARLTYMGRAVRDEQTMRELGVRDGDKFILITQTRGGEEIERRLSSFDKGGFSPTDR